MVEDIMKMFEGKSPEELLAMSKPLSDEDFDELPDDVKLQLMRSRYSDDDEGEDLADEFRRKLQ
jgi:hypothetical protein